MTINHRAIKYIVAFSVVLNPLFFDSAMSANWSWLKSLGSKIGKNSSEELKYAGSELERVGNKATIIDQGVARIDQSVARTVFKDQLAEETETMFSDFMGRVASRDIPPTVGRGGYIDVLASNLDDEAQFIVALSGPEKVGKTQITAGLAARIQEGQVPRSLRGVKVVEIHIDHPDFANIEGFKANLRKLKEKNPNDKFIFEFPELHRFLARGEQDGYLDFNNYMYSIQMVFGEKNAKIVLEGVGNQVEQLRTKYPSWLKFVNAQDVLPLSKKEITEVLTNYVRRKEIEFGDVRIPEEIVKKAQELADLYYLSAGSSGGAIQLINEAASFKHQMPFSADSILSFEMRAEQKALKEELKKAEEILRNAPPGWAVRARQ